MTDSKTACCAVYRYTATFTGRYNVQLHLYSYSCSSAPRDAPGGGVWNSNNA